MATSSTSLMNESVNSAKDGRWSYDTPGMLEPGYHRVELDDGQGAHAEASFFIVAPGKSEPVFVVKDHVSLVDRVERVMPGGMGWLLALSLLLIVLLAAWNMRLARKAEKVVEPQKRQRLLNTVMFVSAATVVVAFSVGAFIHRKVPVFEEVIQQVRPAATTSRVDVSGSVVGILDVAGVSGVDLAVGDTSIHTQDGGRYVFREVDVATGIRLTQPELKRAFVWQVGKGGEMAMPFDVGLYNILVDTMDMESRGQASQLYDLLPEMDRATLTRELFVEERRDRISSRRLLQQEVVLKSVAPSQDWRSPTTGHVWKQAALVETVFGDRSYLYAFAYDQGTWHPVR